MRIFTILALILFSTVANASHLLGGYITYRYLSGKQYEITLTLYRDCNSTTPFDGTAQASNPATIGLFYSNTPELASTIDLHDPIITTVNAPSGPCLIPPSICVEQGVYTGIVTLPSVNNNFTLVYERCCLPPAINNVANPDEAGAVYSAVIPANINNSSPVISIPVQRYVPIFDTVTIENWYNSTDGDSLSFQLTDLFSGGSLIAPAPNPPLGPPYNTVQWYTGYNANTQLGSASHIDINAVSGKLTIIPRWSGTYMISITVFEWRNNQIISNYPVVLNITSTDCNRDTTYVDTTQIPTEPVGINEVHQNSIEVFPNPANDNITISGLANDRMNVRLIDLNGRELEQRMPGNGTCTFTGFQQYAKGIYIIQVENTRRKIVIQ